MKSKLKIITDNFFAPILLCLMYLSNILKSISGKIESVVQRNYEVLQTSDINGKLLGASWKIDRISQAFALLYLIVSFILLKKQIGAKSVAWILIFLSFVNFLFSLLSF